jgi:3-hydroxybutyryl-CoA dehydratase
MVKTEPKRYGYRELAQGDVFEFYGVTISESHAIQFAGMTGDFNPLHMDERWCKENSIFRTRVMHGTYTLSLVMGPLGMMFAGTALANVGMSFKLPAPVKFGDTLYSKLSVLEKHDKPKYGGGLVKFNLVGSNQDGEVVFDGEVNLLLRNSLQEGSAELPG